MDAPLLGEKDEFPEFTREILRVQWRPGDPIDLYVIRPHGVALSPAFLLLYSYPTENNRFLDNDYCKRVTQGGYAAVGFVSALTGHRYHMRPMREWFVSELQESLGTSVHDVQLILDYLASRGDIDMEQIGMFAQGSGASIAILAAAADPRIKALDLLSPWGDWPDWLKQSFLVPEEERPNYVKAEFLARVAPLDPVQYLPQLASRRIRIQQIVDDAVTAKDCQERIAAAAPPSAKVIRYNDSTALYHAWQAAGNFFGWIKEQLKAQPSLVSAGE